MAAVRARDDHGWEPVEKRTPLDALIATESADVSREEMQIKLEAFHELLAYFFQRGPHPAHVMQLVYAVAKALRPDLIAHMTVRDLAKMFADTPAAWSWRIEQCVSKLIAKAGMRGVRLPFQKTDSARASYRAAQQGNTNRAVKRRPRAPLPHITSADNCE